MVGLTRKQEFIGLTPIDFSLEFQPDGMTSTEKGMAYIERCLQERSVRFEWIHKRVDNTEFWAEIIITKILLNGEDIRYAITRDISEKKELELKLYERNAELNLSNTELEHMITHLRETQSKLIEAEKMASLGALVAGVAHEINTPVGVGLVGITQFKDEINELRQRYNEGALTPDDFESFIASATDLSDLVKTNLDRTAHLVKGFKQVAVDQTSEEDREVNLNDYLHEIVVSLNAVIKRANVRVDIYCPADVLVLLNPGLIYQVISNLIMNSINHAFSPESGGTIGITIRELERHVFELKYCDNGKGISAENLPKIFNPFFTTNRAKGGTGLGLNVTYNIVTSALGGSIECHSKEGQGVEFLIRFNVQQRIT